MIWADKLVAVLASALFFLGLLIGMTSGNPGSVWLPAFLHIYLYLLLILATPLWVVLRVIDALLGGPRRRYWRMR